MKLRLKRKVKHRRHGRRAGKKKNISRRAMERKKATLAWRRARAKKLKKHALETKRADHCAEARFIRSVTESQRYYS